MAVPLREEGCEGSFLGRNAERAGWGNRKFFVVMGRGAAVFRAMGRGSDDGRVKEILMG